MTDTLTTHKGELVTAHIGPIHLDNTPDGVEVTLVGSVSPTAKITKHQAAALAQALNTVH